MKYLCVIYFEEEKVEALPAQELDGIASECFRYSETPKQTGQLIACEPLSSIRTAITLRMAACPPSTARLPRRRNNWAVFT